MEPRLNGPAEFFSVDRVTAYKSREMKEIIEAEVVKLIEAPPETPSKIGVVERYHALLRAAYTEVRSVLSRTTPDSECLQMAVFSVNNTISPEGLCHTLLLFGAIPSTACVTEGVVRAERVQPLLSHKLKVRRRLRERFAKPRSRR